MNANLLFIFLLLISLTLPVFSQQLACKKEAFSALRPIPKLKYQCNENLPDYENEILRQKNRLSALNHYVKSLGKFTFADWWRVSVDDLNVCDFRRKVGVLSKEQKRQFENGEYLIDLFGNAQIRVVRVSDPCFQPGFGGSNIFLLNRKNDNVFVTEIIDGFFSRADMIFVDFAKNGAEQIIEIATSSGGLNPTETYYYFTINPKTNRALPKNLFLSDNKKLTNQITSQMLLEDAEDYGLPPTSESLQIISKGRLAKKFDIFIDTYQTFGEEKHKKFTKLTLHWNGKFYQ